MKYGPGAVRIGEEIPRYRLPAWPLLAMAVTAIVATAVWMLLPPAHPLVVVGPLEAQPEPPGIQGLEIIARAELEYFRRHGAMWTGDVASLGVLETADVAPDVDVGAPRAWNGYWFLAMEIDALGRHYDPGRGVNPTSFAFCAFPENGGATFIRDQSGSVWAKTGAGVVLRWPADPAAMGWIRIR